MSRAKQLAVVAVSLFFLLACVLVIQQRQLLSLLFHQGFQTPISIASSFYYSTSDQPSHWGLNSGTTETPRGKEHILVGYLLKAIDRNNSLWAEILTPSGKLRLFLCDSEYPASKATAIQTHENQYQINTLNVTHTTVGCSELKQELKAKEGQAIGFQLFLPQDPETYKQLLSEDKTRCPSDNCHNRLSAWIISASENYQVIRNLQQNHFQFQQNLHLPINAILLTQ